VSAQVPEWWARRVREDLAASMPRCGTRPAGVLGYIPVPRRHFRRAWLPEAYTADRDTARIAAGMRGAVVTALVIEVKR
jgi:hypothetical protein